MINQGKHFSNMKEAAYEDVFRLICNDSLAELKNLPSESVDIIFADPPYFLSNGGTTCHSGKRVSVDKGEGDKGCDFQKNEDFNFQGISQCARILKADGAMGLSGTSHSIFTCGYILQKEGWEIINDIVMYKTNPPPNVGCRSFKHSHETLIGAKKNKDAKHFFNYELSKHGDWAKDILKNSGTQMKSVWNINRPIKKEKAYGKHPTQKPEALLERIICLTSETGDTVLDPFNGSGTTGTVAIRHSRKFIGIDFEPTYTGETALPRMMAELDIKEEDLIIETG